MKLFRASHKAFRTAGRYLQIRVLEGLCRAFLLGVLLFGISASAPLFVQCAPVHFGLTGNYVALA
jgi:hypothetical protein